MLEGFGKLKMLKAKELGTTTTTRTAIRKKKNALNDVYIKEK